MHQYRMAQFLKLKRCMLALLVIGSVCVCGLLLTSSGYVSNPRIGEALRDSNLVYRLLARMGVGLDGPDHTEVLDQTQVLDPEEEAFVRQRFEDRLATLHAACQRYGNYTEFNRLPLHLFSATYHIKGRNVTAEYCAIQKTSSTTWKHIFNKLQKRGNYITSENASSEKITFAFVRDPYMRLLSAYTDKLLSPNALFWAEQGRNIVQLFRENPSPHSVLCGHDITFAEFIKFVIWMQKSSFHRDGHFVPTHDHCDWCTRAHQYIGHLETISQDMTYILKAMDSPVEQPKDFSVLTLLKNANLFFSRMRTSIEKCITLEEACRRLWKKWHIRGIISKTEPFPLTKEQSVNISLEAFQNATLSVFERSREKADRNGQKKEALREAFASVPFSDIEQLQELLFLDFKLFGFNPAPDIIFVRNYTEETNDSFSYFDLYS